MGVDCNMYDEMAELMEGTCILGERKYWPMNKMKEATPGPSSILIDPVLLVESVGHKKLYSDIDSDGDVLLRSNTLRCDLH